MEMTKPGRDLHYFLAANTPTGFYSLFSELYSPAECNRAYIIKGGPGTGKSSLMKKCADNFISRGLDVEYIHCSSDPDSLDGILLSSQKLCMADGTAPHVIEPFYAGASETLVNLYDCFNEEGLKASRGKIIGTSDSIAEIYKRVYSYLAAAGNVLGDNYKICTYFTDYGKIARYAVRLCRMEIGLPKKNAGPGTEIKRFLSGITPGGFVTYEDTIHKLCKKVYFFEDDFGASASALLEKIRTYCLKCGLEIICCRCPMSPDSKLEHILIPSLSLAFVTVNKYHPFDRTKPYKRIHVRRFLDNEGLAQHRQKVNFNKKLVRALLDGAILLLKTAKALHDELEKCYMPCVDFSKVDEKTARLIQEMNGLI